MNLYIQIENGQPVNHPSLEENLIQAFGEVPLNWEPFVRIAPPVLGDYETFDDPHVVYEKIDGVWTDVHQVIEMSEEEKTAREQAKKQAQIKLAKLAFDQMPYRDNFAAWTLNENTLKFEPPIPRPTDREVYWQGKTNSWVDRPQKPDDGKTYRIDFDTGTWVEYQPPQE